MTGKEILKRAIRLEPTDRAPVIILSGGVWAYNQVGKSLQDSFDMSPEESSDFWAETNKRLQSDLIWCAAGCNNLGLRGIGAEADFSKVGVAASVKPCISSASDVDKLDIGKIKEDPGVQAMLASTKLMKEKMGNDTLLAVSQWGPMTLASLMLGAENFMIMLRKDAEGAKYVMDFTKELVVEYWNLFIEAGVEHVSQAEPVASGDMISPKMFAKVALPYLQYTNKAIGDKATKMLHICGNTNRLFEMIPETGTQMFSMDYKVDLALAREKMGGKVAFAGIIDPAEIMLMSSPEVVAKDAKRCLAEAEWEKGGFILMPGCDLAPATPWENLESMVKVAHETKQ